MMRKFIKRFLGFTLVLVIANLLCFTFNQVYTPTTINIVEEQVFLGNSHIRRSLNPAILPNSKNLASNGELYINSYHKLKYLLNHFEQINSAVIGFSFIDMSYTLDTRFMTAERGKRYIENSWFYMPPSVFFEDTKAPLDLILGSLYKSEFLYPKFKDPVLVNGFAENPDNMTTADLEAKLNWHFYIEGVEANISEMNLKYLNKIIVLCQEKSVRLTLLVTPLHPDYLERVPKKFLTQHATLLSQFETQGVNIIDLRNYLEEDRYFADHNHVSGLGAQMVSQKVNEMLTSN